MSAFPPDSITPVVKEIAEILTKRKETVSVSEAACGGLLSAYLVSVPGASNWFHGGTLVYSLKSKLKLSGWSQDEIDTYTGPSEKVVLRLARNLRVDLGSTYVLSETGIAGPSIQLNESKKQDTTNPFSNKEIGTVYLGVSTPSGERSNVFSTKNSDRSYNMQKFAEEGLKFFLSILKEKENDAEVEAEAETETENELEDGETVNKKQKV